MAHQLAKKIHLPAHQVDAHNIVPVWHASAKQEYTAYTLRSKIHHQLSKFLTPFPQLIKHPYSSRQPTKPINWQVVQNKIKAKPSNHPITWIQPGQKAAQQATRDFIAHRLKNYAQKRNNPSLNHLSHLSPYLHFGHLSAQHLANQVNQSSAPSVDKQAFLEELIIRKELADNYCYYNRNYNNISGFPTWAQASLQTHQSDKRPFLYTQKQFESASTHDDLWNAAQNQLVQSGKMHGYMRMYWAKKILEWTPEPQTAQDITIYLNDLYSLDGRDPNGYAGIAWSIGGVHDRPWFERPIFGKVRYMNSSGANRKFNTQAYISQWLN